MRSIRRTDRRVLSQKRILLLSAVLLVVVFIGGELVSRALFAPWSIGVLGRDTLTGSWVGEMEARQGAVYGVSLDLQYKSRAGNYRRSAARSTRSSNLEGRATVCTPTGERYDYAVSGRANRSGAVESLWLEYADPSLSALNLRMSGRWRAPDLTLTPDANPFLPDGRFVSTRTLSSANPDDSFVPAILAKDDEATFEAICQRIWIRNQ